MAANPMAALNAINPSLVGYTGGYGKALQSLGGSMTSMGQAKLDLEKQAADQKYRNDMYQLSLNADTRAADAVDYTKKKDFETKIDKLNTNVATNAFLMGKEVPTEMSNDYAKLSLIDPAMTAAALKQNDDKYSGTAGGIIYNTKTGAVAGDYRETSANSGLGAKGTTHVDTIKNGQVMRTFIKPDGSTQSVMIGGTPTGIAGMQFNDALQDNNAYQRPQITNTVKQDITAGNAITKGGLPIKISSNPKIAEEQKSKWAIPLDSGGWYVPAAHVSDYMKRFPSK